jgi:hypothetical protein
MKEVSRCVLTFLAAALLFSATEIKADAPAGRYTISAGTVFDKKTKLTWQRSVSATQSTWADAINSCPSGWRLPTFKELLTLADYGRANPAIDPTAFPSTPAALFWTSTVPSGGGGAYIVNFANGGGGVGDPATLYYVRCVQ